MGGELAAPVLAGIWLRSGLLNGPAPLALTLTWTRSPSSTTIGVEAAVPG